MTIREIQKKIADALNGVEALIQGGCKALAEDAKDVFFEVKQALDTFDGNTIVAQLKINVNKNGPSPQLWTLYKKNASGTASPAGGWPNGQSHSGGNAFPKTANMIPQTP